MTHEPATRSEARRQPGPFHIIDDLLSDDLNQALLRYAMRRQRDARPSLVMTAGGETFKPDQRIAHNLPLSRTLRRSLRKAFDGAMPQILGQFADTGFKPSATEIEMVAHGNRAFFGRHIDTLGVGVSSDAKADRSRRFLSVVYYINMAPRAFVGGNLRIYSSDDGPETHTDIEPENNRAVVFPSYVPHEVLPVWLASDRWEDSRFAINYWLYT